MDAAIVRQFLDFFQDFVNLCQLENWPENDTSETEIKNAFLAAEHVEKCLDRLQKKKLLNEFLSVLNSSQNANHAFIKTCFCEPQKFVLKKIITSNSKINQMDVGFNVFLQLYSEEKLEKYLSEIMVESASKETLLSNMSEEFPKDKLLEFKSMLFLNELSTSEDSKHALVDLIQGSNNETLELIVVSLMNTDFRYYKCIRTIVDTLCQVMKERKQSDKEFWKLLFNLDDSYLMPVCLKYDELFKLMVKALLDCGKLIKENMSAEYFYIDLSYSELVSAVRKLCRNENLKLEFLDIAREIESDVEFWNHVLSKSV